MLVENQNHFIVSKGIKLYHEFDQINRKGSLKQC